MISLFRKLSRYKKTQAKRQKLGIDLKRRDSLLIMFWSFTSLRSNKTLLAAENLPSTHSSPIKSTIAIEQALSSFLDTLIPADNISPSASQAGVTEDILNFSRNDKLLHKLITLGCQWLDLQTPVKFTELPEDVRERILTWMSQAKENSLPRKFFDITRHLSMGFYYRKPASWKGLPITRPPQPLGYPDFQG